MRDWIFVAEAVGKIQVDKITSFTVLHCVPSDAVTKSFLTASDDNNNNSEDHPAGVLIIHAPLV